MSEMTTLDAETNAQVQVMVLDSALQAGDEVRINNNRLHKVDPSSNALIPVIHLDASEEGDNPSGSVTQVQADYAQTDDTQVDFIKNKPVGRAVSMWVSNRAYKTGDIVIRSTSDRDLYYRVYDGQDMVQPGTNEAVWQRLSGVRLDEWQASREYITGDIVKLWNRLYYAEPGNKNMTPGGVEDRWKKLFTNGIIEEWSSSGNYPAGAIVRSNGNLMRALSSHGSSAARQPNSDGSANTWWEPLMSATTAEVPIDLRPFAWSAANMDYDSLMPAPLGYEVQSEPALGGYSVPVYGIRLSKTFTYDGIEDINELKMIPLSSILQPINRILSSGGEWKSDGGEFIAQFGQHVFINDDFNNTYTLSSAVMQGVSGGWYLQFKLPSHLTGSSFSFDVWLIFY
jgi:hypothetical protein